MQHAGAAAYRRVMQHDWLEDVVAVLDTGSFSGAADRRCVNRSTFTRRIAAIEDLLGVELFDRGSKPVALRRALREQETQMRRLMAEMRCLRETLTRPVVSNTRAITVACQTDLAASIAPQLTKDLGKRGFGPVRLIACDRDGGLLDLLSQKVDLLVAYDQAGADARAGFLARTIGQETFAPVCTPSHLTRPGSPRVIEYAPDTFLAGALYRSGERPKSVPVAETADVQTAYCLATQGMGVAWLPLSMVETDLRAGRLVQHAGAGPLMELDIRLLRLKDTADRVVPGAWEALAG